MYFIAACSNCKHWHRKCDRLLPGCTLCQQRNIPCEYKSPKKRRRPNGEENEDNEWESSVVQYSTLNNRQQHSTFNLQHGITSNTLSVTTPPTIPKHITIPETFLIDKEVLQQHSQNLLKGKHPTSALAAFIQNSLAFLEQFSSFNDILALESSMSPVQFQSLHRQYKINFAFVQSMQAAAYSESSTLSSVGFSSPNDKSMIEKHDSSFRNALATIMSDTTIYLDTPNNITLAWIWASLAMSSMIDASKYSSIGLLLKNLVVFLENHPKRASPQTHQQKRAKLFTTPVAARNTTENDEFIPILENIQTHLHLFSKTSIDEEFDNYSLWDNIKDFKNVMRLDCEIVKELEPVYNLLCNSIELMEKIQIQFAAVESSIQDLEPLIVQTLLSLDTSVQTFLSVSTSTEKLPDIGTIPMSFGIFEIKLKFIEELMMALKEKSNHEMIVANLEKVRLTTANQMFRILRWRDDKLLHKGQFNLRRCCIKIANIHLDNIREIAMETLQWEYKLLSAMQQCHYMASKDVELTAQKLRMAMQEKEASMLDKSIPFQLVAQPLLQQYTVITPSQQEQIYQDEEIPIQSSFFELDNILNNFLV